MSVVCSIFIKLLETLLWQFLNDLPPNRLFDVRVGEFMAQGCGNEERRALRSPCNGPAFRIHEPGSLWVSLCVYAKIQWSASTEPFGIILPSRKFTIEYSRSTGQSETLSYSLYMMQQPTSQRTYPHTHTHSESERDKTFFANINSKLY